MRIRLYAVSFLALGITALWIVGAALAAPGPVAVPGGALPLRSLGQVERTWSSGWVDIAPGQSVTLTHNYGGDPGLYAVDLWQRDTRPGGLGVHRKAHGTLEMMAQYYGVYWHSLTEDTITVVRAASDMAAHQVLVRICVPDQLAYDSDWQDIARSGVLTLTHSVGGDLNDYTVGLRFRDVDGPLGIHHYGVGGEMGLFGPYGGAWQLLTDSIVQLLRFPADTAAQQMRVSIYQPRDADYDSGWQALQPGEMLTLPHNLGGNRDRYVVRVWARADDRGIHMMGAGGMEQMSRLMGFHWQRLTTDSVTLVRWAQDPFVEALRLRIWVGETHLYLPLIMQGAG